MTAVRLTGVGRRFGGIVALEHVDLVVPRATLVALAGANGSGKSTMLRIIAGIIAPDVGEVLVFGRVPDTVDASFRMSIGYAGQHAALDGEITGDETLRLFHALRGLPRRERDARLATLVEEFELASFHRRRVGGYSGGQRQRLHLVLETMHAPALLLLDEPTSSLDPAGRASLWRRLVAWRDRGHTVIVATHDLADVEAHCDRAIVLHAGTVVADASPAELVARHGCAQTTIELTVPPHDADALRGDLERAIVRGGVTIDGSTVTIMRDRAPSEVEPALDVLREHRLVPLRFELHPADLAGAYFALTGRAVDASQGTSARGVGRARGGAGRRGHGAAEGGSNRGGDTDGGAADGGRRLGGGRQGA